MISSIFGRTKPINFIILLVFTLLFMAVFLLTDQIPVGETLHIPRLLLSVTLVAFTLLLIDFINRKNNLTRNNSYLNLFFILFLCMFPKIFLDLNLIISNIFILLAFRRLISIKSGQQVELKIFDASLWICLAAFFYSWAILFLFLVYLTVFLYSYHNYKNLLIPFVALFTVGIISLTYSLYLDNFTGFKGVYQLSPEFDFNKYYDPRYLFPIVFLMGFGFISVLIYFFKLKNKTSRSRVADVIILAHLTIAFFVASFSESPNTSELLFIGFPLAVILTKYIETIQRHWLKEGILWIFAVIPFLILFL